MSEHKCFSDVRDSCPAARIDPYLSSWGSVYRCSCGKWWVSRWFKWQPIPWWHLSAWWRVWSGRKHTRLEHDCIPVLKSFPDGPYTACRLCGTVFKRDEVYLPPVDPRPLEEVYEERRRRRDQALREQAEARAKG